MYFGYTEKAPVEAQDGHFAEEKRDCVDQFGDVEEKPRIVEDLFEGSIRDVSNMQAETLVDP